MKLFSLIFLLSFLTSCTLGVSAPQDQSSTGQTVTSSGISSEVVTITGSQTLSTGSVNTPKAPNSEVKPQTPTSSLPVSTKTEDELVKDFESEIDGLLNTIEKDAAKK